MENKNKIQKIQNQVKKFIVEQRDQNKNPRQRHQQLNWLSVDAEIKLATHKQTFKILNQNIPEILATKMIMNKNNNRIKEHKILHTKPRWLNSNLQNSRSFQSRSYLYNTLPKELTKLESFDKFKKNTKIYLMTKPQKF